MLRKLEKWLNKQKRIATTIITISILVAIAVTWVGHDNYLEIKSRVVLNLEIPTAHAESPQNAILDVLEGTQMEDAIPYIGEASQYFNIPIGIFLGIANAESSFKHFPDGTYNPFGIKPNNSLKGYDNWEHSINGFSQLIKYYYIEEGLDSCQKIMRKYVGYQSDDWVRNCQKYYR